MSKTIIGALGVVEKDGKVLLSLRNDPTHPDLHNRWEFPGGGVEWDEYPQEALIREMLEETKIKIKIVSLIPHVLVRFFGKANKVKVVFLPYLCKYISGTAKSSDPEVAQVQWADKKDLKKLRLSPLSKQLIDLVKI